jgi:HK97 family phage portal protein
MLRNIFERRGVSFQSVWGSGGELEVGTLSATAVNSDTALQVNAIWSAVQLISNSISTLPVDSYQRVDGRRLALRPRPQWVTKPDVDTTKEAFYGAVLNSLLLDGNAFIRVYRNQQNRIVNMVVLNPLDVRVKRNGLGRVMFEFESSKEVLDGTQVLFIPDIVRPGHIRGVSRVEAMKEDFGLAIALRNYAAKFFGSGTQTSGVIEVPGNITAEQAKNLSDAFDSRHRGWFRSHRTAVISGGAKYVPTSVENDKAQFLDSRRLAVEDIARVFGIPSNFLNLPGTNTYSSVEQNSILLVTYALRPYVQKLETALTQLLVEDTGNDSAFIRFSLDGLLRADISTRMNAYSIGLNSGFLTINDVRRLEDLPPIQDASADSVRVPLANVNIDAAELVGEEKKVNMANKLVISGYDPAEVLAALEMPPIRHTGLASVQLQGVAQVNPEDPQSVYEVE